MPELAQSPEVQVYQFHILLLQISSAIWRRALVRSDSTLADLHYIIQILMGWEDIHLHRFVLHGKVYGINKPDVLFDHNPSKVLLCDLQLRLKERFIYEYDFSDSWQHQLRLEQILYWQQAHKFDRRAANRELRRYADDPQHWVHSHEEVRISNMKVKVQVSIEHDDYDGEGSEGEPAMADVAYVACFERAELNPATLGLALAEGKTLLAGVQQTLVMAQAAAHVEEHRHCPHCRSPYQIKGQHTLTMRTVFGKLKLPSPRYYSCPCRSCQPELAQKKSFSPLAELLPERTAPEFQYLQTKWAALMSYGVTAKLLEPVMNLEREGEQVEQNEQPSQ